MFQMDYDGAVIRPDVDRIVDEFALQLLHDGNDGAHQAGGLMQLDMSLMTMLLGALTVLLVMLIQFDASARNATSKVASGSHVST